MRKIMFLWFQMIFVALLLGGGFWWGIISRGFANDMNFIERVNESWTQLKFQEKLFKKQEITPDKINWLIKETVYRTSSMKEQGYKLQEIKKQAEIQLSAGTLQWQFIDGGNTRKWTAYQTDQNETHRYTLLLYRQKETYQIDLIYQYQYTNRGDLLSSDHMAKMICATKGLFSSEYIIFSCIEGHSNDKLIKSVRKKTDQMMKELEAQQVDFVDEGTFVSIAAYTDHWESTFSSAEKKLNMQLAFRIGERETKWFFGTPLLLE